MKKTLFIYAAAWALLLTQACKKNSETSTETANSGTPQSGTNTGLVLSDSLSATYSIYTISNVAGGKSVQVAGDILNNEKYNDDAKIEQAAASINNSVIDSWQRWHIIYKTTVNGTKYYQIRNVFSGKVLYVPNGTTPAGTQLQQNAESVSPSNEQLWSVKVAGSAGNYYLINKGSGMAITNVGSAGAAVTQEALTSADNQKWVLTQQAADTYRDDAVVRFFNRNSGFMGSVAFDEGTSVPLTWGANNGKVLWITQDAWDGSSLQLNGKFNCNNFFSYGNSILIQPSATNWDPNATGNMTRNGSAQGRPKQICDIQPNNTFAWPGPAVEIDNHVYIQVGEGSGLTSTDQSLYDLTESASSVWVATRTTPAGLSGQTTIGYAAGMVKAADGYVYAFGTKSVGFGYELNVFVARFPVSNPQLWTFWNGTTWGSTPSTAAAGVIGQGLGSATVSYVNGKYVMITMDQGFNCDASRNIYASVSSSPTSVFSARKQVYTIKEYLYGNYARYYTPAIHPESVNGRDELLVTYCLNYSGCGVASCSGNYLDPYFYRVKGIRIPYGKIGL